MFYMIGYGYGIYIYINSYLIWAITMQKLSKINFSQVCTRGTSSYPQVFESLKVAIMDNFGIVPSASNC